MMNAETFGEGPADRLSGSDSRARGMDLLSPSLRDFSYLDCHFRAKLIQREAATLVNGRAILLDIGGMGKPYASFFEKRVARHFVLDAVPADTVDVVGDARHIPFADGSADAVLCTQVIEHIPEPAPVLQDIWRILKPGGKLILSVPGIFPQHGYPGDYWRYMPQGLAWLLRDFSSVQIRGETGTFGSLFVTLNMFLYTFTGRALWLRKLVSWLICPITNVAGLLAAGIYRGDQFASNYFVVATR